MNDRVAVHVITSTDELSQVVASFGFRVSSSSSQEIEERLVFEAFRVRTFVSDFDDRGNGTGQYSLLGHTTRVACRRSLRLRNSVRKR